MSIVIEGFYLQFAIWYLCGIIGIATVTMLDELEGADTATFPEGLLASFLGIIALLFSFGCILHYYSSKLKSR